VSSTVADPRHLLESGVSRAGSFDVLAVLIEGGSNRCNAAHRGPAIGLSRLLASIEPAGGTSTHHGVDSHR